MQDIHIHGVTKEARTTYMKPCVLCAEKKIKQKKGILKTLSNYIKQYFWIE